jgi:hypothetical protein
MTDEEVGRRCVEGVQQLPEQLTDVLERRKLPVPLGSAFAAPVVQEYPCGFRELGSNVCPSVGAGVPAVLKHD